MKRRVSANLVVFVLGLLLVTAGLYLIYPPVALVTSGAVLMIIALFGDRRP